MPKLKSNRGAAKRFRPTGSGGFKCRSAKRRHQMRAKTTNVKRKMAQGFIVREEDTGRIEQMLPYQKGKLAKRARVRFRKNGPLETVAA